LCRSSADFITIIAESNFRYRQAINLANECGKNGKPAVVLLQRSKNQFGTIWTYGESPFPPSKSDLPSLSQV
jgi:hypothetical protein